MKQSMIRREFAVMNNAYSRYTFSYFLGSMERLGLSLIDLWGGIQHFDPFSADESSIGILRKTLADREMKVSSYTPEILAYPFNFAAASAKTRKDSIEYCKRNLWIASELEVPVMLISPGYGMWDEPYEEGFKRSLDSMHAAAEIAEEYGVKLALEHLTPQSSNLLTNVNKVERMVNAVNSRFLGAALDLGQMSVFRENVDAYFDKLGTKIFMVHIMDGTPSCHLAFGEGVLPLKQYYENVRERGYNGPLTLEINDGRYSGAPHEALAKCVEMIRTW